MFLLGLLRYWRLYGIPMLLVPSTVRPCPNKVESISIGNANDDLTEHMRSRFAACFWDMSGRHG